MRFTSRGLVLALCAALVWQTPASARVSRRVLGVVVQADHGRLDNAAAVIGANVYSCDQLSTDEGGVLRVKVGSNQLFLSAVSSAALEDEGSTIQALAMGGTVGFSSTGSDGFSMRTPVGVLRAVSGQAASAQVTFAGPHEIMISSIHGNLTLDTGGEFRTIPDGQSAKVTFDSSIDMSCHDEPGAAQSQPKAYSQSNISFQVVMGGGAALAAYFLWRELTESDSKPKP